MHACSRAHTHPGVVIGVGANCTYALYTYWLAGLHLERDRLGGASSMPPDNAPRALTRRDRPGEAAIDAALAHARSKTALLVNERVCGNPVLQHVRHVRKESSRGLSADFVCGPTTCVLYLSLQYHALHPTYIYARVRELGRAFRTRILLAVVDVDAAGEALRELSSLALLHDICLILSRDDREAARYLEALRAYDQRADAADFLRGRIIDDDVPRLHAVLSAVRGISKPDAAALAYNLGSFYTICNASADQLRAVPGLGDVKVSRLHAALHLPFRVTADGVQVEEADSPEAQ